MSLIVHGGAGDIPLDERPLHAVGLAAALEAGWKVLEAEGTALDAVEAAVRMLEDDPAFDAGVGAVLRLDGSISLDAAIMEGTGRRAGAVAGVTRVRHPVSLARHILERTPHVLLISRGAEDLALAAGLEMCEPAFFITPRETARLERILRARKVDGTVNGTVGAVARDARGGIAAATSTGGAPGSLPGRVGDTPIIGAGTLADDRLGGASLTGQGENMIRTSLAREVVRVLGGGTAPAEAVRWALDHLRAETGGTGGIICIGADGEPASGFSTPWMGSLSRSLSL